MADSQRAGAAPAGDFELGEPVLVCRWRLAAKRVPLLNRHIRALAQRRLHDEPLPRNLVSWAKQHIEWAVADDAYAYPDGVLMIVVDRSGRAAMSVGPYEPVTDASAAALAARAERAALEARATGIAPEALCAESDGGIVIAVPASQGLSGSLSLAEQLASTRRLPVSRVDTPSDLPAGAPTFLVSDEHGVIAATDAAMPSTFAGLLADGFTKLAEAAR